MDLLGTVDTDLTSEAVGVPLAAVLALLPLALLRGGERRRAWQGVVLLGLSVLAGSARFLFRADASVRRPLLFLATFFLLASIGRSAVLILADVVLQRRRARPTPRIFRDVTTGVSYLVVALVALHEVGVEPGSILTTSALLTAVVGLALQDTLGNLVSGLALQMQRPFDVGDWVEIESGHAGQVTEVTWRATSVMTLDRVEVILPNSAVAKAAIRNYSRPSKVARRKLHVGVTYDAAPSEVQAVLTAAARETPGVLVEPAPRTRTRSFGDSSIQYEVLFFVDDFEHAVDIDGAVADRAYHALERRGFSIPYPTRTMRFTSGDQGASERRQESRARVAASLARLDLVAPLPDDAREVLYARAALLRFGPGEAVVRKGDPSTEMYVVERGTLAVLVPRDNGPALEVAELKTGDCFGEMGLLTGEPRAATVRAKTLCDLVTIDHDAFHEVIAAHPEVVERMGTLLATRQAGLERAAAAEEQSAPVEERKKRLISQIRSFFRLV